MSHPRLAEAEAVNRLIAMAALVDQPVVVFHVTTEGSMRAIRDAQTRGQKVFAETCPQYLFLTADHLDRPGCEGAKWMFSPPARDAADQEAMWRGIRNGTFQIVSSDHAPYRFDETGKLAQGPDAALQADRERHSRASRRACRCCSRRASRPAGSTSTASSSCAAPTPPRSTACIPRRARSRSARMPISRSGTRISRSRSRTRTTHDATGYCPYAGMTLTGWPVTVDLARRGDRRWRRAAGRARPRPLLTPPAARTPGRCPRSTRAQLRRDCWRRELDPRRNFGASCSTDGATLRHRHRRACSAGWPRSPSCCTAGCRSFCRLRCPPSEPGDSHGAPCPSCGRARAAAPRRRARAARARNARCFGSAICLCAVFAKLLPAPRRRGAGSPLRRPGRARRRFAARRPPRHGRPRCSRPAPRPSPTERPPRPEATMRRRKAAHHIHRRRRRCFVN